MKSHKILRVGKQHSCPLVDYQSGRAGFKANYFSVPDAAYNHIVRRYRTVRVIVLLYQTLVACSHHDVIAPLLRGMTLRNRDSRGFTCDCCVPALRKSLEGFDFRKRAHSGQLAAAGTATGAVTQL